MAQITITINESDSYGDGWQGQWVRIFDSNGVEVAAHTLESGSSGSDTFTLSDGADYTWTFGEGSWIEEASFTMVRDDTGEVLAQASGAAASGSFTLGEASAEEEGEADITSDLVGRWSFESDGSDSVGDNDGTLDGVTCSGDASFGGDDFVQITDTLGINWGSSKTVSFWVQSTQETNAMLIQKSYDASGGNPAIHSLWLNNEQAGKANFYYRDNSGSLHSVASTTDVNDGSWHHVVMVHDGTELKMYVGGSLEATTTGVSQGVFDTDEPIYLGVENKPWSGVRENFFTGSLDDLRIWSRALSASDVTALYDAGRDPVAPADITSDLVGRWSFEADGSDSVGDNDGTASGVTFENGYAEFDGASHMSIPHDATAQPFDQDNTSVSMWIKTSASGEERLFFKGYGPSSNESLWDHRVMGGKAYFYWREETGSTNVDLTSTSDVNDGNWHHVVISKSGPEITMFVNGSEEATVTGANGTWSGTYDVHLGKWDHPSFPQSHLYNGDMDDLRIWSRALTDADVTALYDAGRDPAEAPASGYTMTALDGTTDAPTGDVGFAKGDEDGFFLQSSGSYVVWFKVGGVWSKHQDGSYSGGMGFAWPASATHAYAQMSAGGQKSFMFPRTELVGMLYDSDDVDSSADKFTSAGMSYDVTEVTVTVSGTTPMDLGMASSFVQVVEAGVLSGAYSVSTGGSTVVSPPEGKDGVELLVRVFS